MPTRTIIDPRIFRAYDIRGKAHEQLTEDACFLIAKAFGSELRERYSINYPVVCVGRDARTHGPGFEKAVIEGLLSTGCRVLHIGQTPSPVNYFTICHEGLDAGMQVTASHNPGHDNGLKLSVRGAEAFAGEDVQLLRKRIDEERLLDGEGWLETHDAVTPYLAHVSSLFNASGTNMRIVVDSGNGVAGPAYCEGLRKVGAEVIELYTEPDGRFPNHPADPSKWETLKDLQRTVLEEEADIGLAFDGDGDRLGVVDEQGNIRPADEVLLLLAKDHLSRHPGAPIVFTVSNSSILDTEVRTWGGKPALCKVGHSNVEHAMHEHGALLGGEVSGHFFCGEDYFGFDDAVVAGLRVLAILQATKQPLSTLMAEFPKVYKAPERRPTVPDDVKGKVIEQVIIHFSSNYDVLTLDGVRIDFGEGAWAGIRQSNTSPCISIFVEARSPEKLKELEELIMEHLQGYPEIEWEE